jgi:hypothetical protein
MTRPLRRPPHSAPGRAGVQTWALLGVFMVWWWPPVGYSLTGSPDQINQVPNGMGQAAAPAAGTEPAAARHGQ